MSRRKNTGLNAFKREVGKNTGKAVSNWIFGDAHSTPYRVKIQREKTKQIEKEAELNEQKELGNLEKEIQKKIHQLSQKSFPKSEKAIISYMLEIEILINSSKWKGVGINGDEKNKITNEYSDALFSKYKQGAELLLLSGGNSNAVAKFETKIKTFRRKKFFGKYCFPILLLSLIIISFTLASIFI
jgi:hypothetical protein